MTNDLIGIRRAARIAEAVLGKKGADDDPLAYWTLILAITGDWDRLDAEDRGGTQRR